MSFHSWLQNLRSALAPRRGQRKHARLGSLRAPSHRPYLEVLEDRLTPSFSAPISYATGTSPYAVVTADFNGDGKLDLAVANDSSNTISVLLGNGDGSFGAAQNYATGSGPLSVAVGDFNGDGKLDLVTANAGDVSVLLGNGPEARVRRRWAETRSTHPPNSLCSQEEFQTAVEEIFNVQVLPGLRFPVVIGFQQETIQLTFVVPPGLPGR